MPDFNVESDIEYKHVVGVLKQRTKPRVVGLPPTFKSSGSSTSLKRPSQSNPLMTANENVMRSYTFKKHKSQPKMKKLNADIDVWEEEYALEELEQEKYKV